MATKSRVPEGKVVCYTYLKPINKKLLVKTSIETGHNMSECLDAFMDSIRSGKPVKLKKKTPKYVEQAKKVSAKKQEKMKALTTKAKKATTKKKTKARPRTKVTKAAETTASI